MTQAVGIVASPRKRMNTDTIVQKILDGCQKAGASVLKIYLNDLEIHPCQSCKIQDGEGCVHRDGMDEIYEIRNRNFQMKILGGCCATDDQHITAIAARL